MSDRYCACGTLMDQAGEDMCWSCVGEALVRKVLTLRYRQDVLCVLRARLATLDVTTGA